MGETRGCDGIEANRTTTRRVLALDERTRAVRGPSGSTQCDMRLDGGDDCSVGDSAWRRDARAVLGRAGADRGGSTRLEQQRALKRLEGETHGFVFACGLRGAGTSQRMRGPYLRSNR